MAGSHGEVCVHGLLVLVGILSSTWSSAAKTISPVVSEGTSQWFITLQLEHVSDDGAVTVLHLSDASALGWCSELPSSKPRFESVLLHLLCLRTVILSYC